MDKKELTVVITNRNTVDYLKLAVESLRKNNTDMEFNLLVMDDNSTDGSKEWLKKNTTKYGFEYWTHDGKDRLGVVGMNEKAIEMSDSKLIFIGHSDMYYAKKCLSNLVRYAEGGKMLCSTRIEPPIYKYEACRIQKPYGVTAEEFKEEEFNKYVDTLLKANEGTKTDGMFAPMLFFKKDWIGYDKAFAPQSREDSDLFYRWKTEGKEFVQVWDSLVYHFSGKGSRRKEGNKDSDEWKKTEQKNLRNFVRKWGSTPIHTQYLNPIIVPKVNLSSVILVGKDDKNLLFDALYNIEPYFNEITIVDDTGNIKDVQDVIDKYNKLYKEEIKLLSIKLPESKLKIVEYKGKDKDFSKLRNLGTQASSHTWVYHHDCDEVLSPLFLNELRFIAQKADEVGVTVFGFPRKNTLDGKDTCVWPDYQFRFHKKTEKWVGKVHEVPEPVATKEEGKVRVGQYGILHEKTNKRQARQNKFYRELTGNEIKNIIVDSVMYTNEGITHHARETVKEFQKRGYNIQLLDFYKENEFGEEYKTMYGPVDVSKKTYFTWVNQPPQRWGRSAGLDNFVGFFAFEGNPRADMVETMNADFVKEIWTPSTYCKEMFEEVGVEKPCFVIPHGISKEWVYGERRQKKPIIFLGAGTWHNQRKGLDLLVKAFNEEFKPNEEVKLILKLSDIYNPGFDASKEVSKYVKKDGNTNIEFITEVLKEGELVRLFHQAHAFVSPHRAEGFGLFILQALASGTPVIATGYSGNVDFSKDRCVLLPPVRDYIPKKDPVYANAIWKEPSLEDLKREMRRIADGKYDFDTKKVSKEIHQEYNWKKIIDKMEERIGTF